MSVKQPVGRAADEKTKKVEGRADSSENALQFGGAWEYAPSPEATDHVEIAPRYELFIGGAWREPSSKKYFDTVSPSTEEKLSEIAEANEKDVDLAVKAARTAYEKYWSKLRPLDRGKYVYRIARAI
jgi:aldehyde dehydrogenase (NAD+)